ncbi:unnamed protein product [Rotaria socialis]|uniref:NAD(P)(+)--arginine ADP-ribosyltransferase n=1 Tax=Rotaria socialis TaxID=392032 RepID=A0A817MDZ4_9BILA|nr:unnamed protein product [Rotaria socialis]CAF3389618.1 unnamed protein product [Rotaria socialis]CAF4443134.1 unnamed protein product [Rotaria socialis]CAF4545133.1 unnamed protein product [Rotaria socialis]
MNRFTEFELETHELKPIAGYWTYDLVSLEESLKGFLSKINELKRSIKEAKKHCTKSSPHNLTPDESAALFLYTMEAGDHSFYRILNQVLRKENRNEVIPWFSYLKLFDTALCKLPKGKGIIWRAVAGNVTSGYTANKTVTWWAVSSCSTSADVVKAFLKPDQEGTLFMIEAVAARDLAGYTMYPNEHEVILKFGTQLLVKNIGFQHGNLRLVHLVEINDDDDDDEDNNNSQQGLAAAMASVHVTPKSTKPTNNKPTHLNIPANAKWTQNGVAIAGGNGRGDATNQLNCPHGLCVGDDQTVVIADTHNHRIIQWKNCDTTSGQVVAGGNGEGSGLNQLNRPTHVLIDKETDSLIICDRGNLRVAQWSRRSGTTQGEILIHNIDCYGLAMDEQRYLYVSDTEKNEVRRYQLGEKNGALVAGGNGAGVGLNELDWPRYLFVDQQQNVYVSDWNNHRVMKWNKDAKESIVVAGGQGEGNAVTQLSYPNGLFVDMLGTLYVVDSWNHRVMRWTQRDKKQGTIIVGGNCKGEGANQFSGPIGLSFDRHGNLYVVDRDNNRVQRFSME